MGEVPLSATDGVDRAAVIAAARGWVGTPYRHQAAVRGAGCDCLGLVRGVWVELYGTAAEEPPAYTQTWLGPVEGERLWAALGRHFREIPPLAARPGDVLLFRMRSRGPAKHAAIASAAGRMVHAYDGHGVMETPIPPAWSRRLVAAFVFPNLAD